MFSGACEGKGLNYLGFFIAGAGIGAGLALLFAPRTGKDTRRFLSRRAEEGREYVSSTGKELFRHAEDALERGKDWAGKLAH